MHIYVSTAVSSVALTAFGVKAYVPMTVDNQCSESIELYDSYNVETVAAGGTTSRTLAEGFSGMFRNGVNAQASLAEFSVADGFLWYDISVIPTGVVDPGCCSSLEECKAVTGNTGYNTPMQIAPSGCNTVTCLEDGCVDAYHFPKDDNKTHTCPDTTSVVLTFCPGDSGGSSQQQQSAPMPMTAPAPAPTQSSTLTPTPAPTSAPTLVLPTPVPTTEASILDPTPEAPTQLQTEISTPMLMEEPTPIIITSEPTPTETITPLTIATSKKKMTSCDDHQETTTVLFENESNTSTGTVTDSVDTTANEVPADTTATDASADYMATDVSSDATATDTSADYMATDVSSDATATDASADISDASADTTTTAVPADTTAATAPTTSAAPLAQVYAPLTSTSTSSKSNGDSFESANTQSSNDNTNAGTYLATGLGCMAVVAAVAVVAVTHKKKQELAAAEKRYSQEEAMTPVTQINVL